MDSPGYIALSRLGAQQRNVDTIAHNLANANTPGFKASRMLFDEYLVPHGGERRPGARELAFVQDRASFRDQAAGKLSRTDNPLDLAITGEGFFVIDTPRGERFTRAGRFTIAPDGRVTTSEGYALLDRDNRPLVVTEQDTRLTVAPDGTLESENGPLGRIRVVDFEDRNRLRPEGEVLFAADGADPRTVDAPKLTQGAVEDSNVEPILEMTRMMNEVREFQFVTQFVEREGERQMNMIERLTRRRN
jgi:flagellar basal-body rod protein FlgF